MSRYDRKFRPSNRRANEQAREAIASILLYKISDPGLRSVTITGCDVSPDKRNAKVFYTASKNDYERAQASFDRANKYIRKMLGDRLEWRVVPDLKFFLDPSVDLGETIAKAFDEEYEHHTHVDFDAENAEGAESADDIGGAGGTEGAHGFDGADCADRVDGVDGDGLSEKTRGA